MRWMCRLLGRTEEVTAPTRLRTEMESAFALIPGGASLHRGRSPSGSKRACDRRVSLRRWRWDIRHD